jgi:kynurenine formamidase
MYRGGKTMWVDLSWPVFDGMPVYPGDRQTRLCQEKWLERDFYAAFALDTGLHAGTHMDAPMHLVPNSPAMAEIPLDRCCAQGVLLDARGQRIIKKPDLPKGSLKGKAVLLLTGMEEAYGTESYYSRHPVVSMELAELLAEEGIAFLGMDMPSPDEPPFPVHKLLLSAGIPMVENMRGLVKLSGPFEVAAFPLKIHAEASPVRAAARLFHDKCGMK